MEQKKILWIFSILLVFLVIVFAMAWFFYSPARRKNNTTVTNLEETKVSLPALAKVDADAWAQNNESIPKPDEDNPPALQIENKVTVVTTTDQDEIDVKSLLDDKKTVEGELPASISNNVVTNIRSSNDDSKNETDESPKENKTTVKKIESKKPKSETKPKASTKKTTTNNLKSQEKKVSKTTHPKTTSAKKAPPKNTKVYWVQTASLTSRLYAEEARKSLQDKNFTAEIFTKETLQGLTHRGRVGPFENKAEADYWLTNIKAIEGFEGSFVSEEKVK